MEYLLWLKTLPYRQKQQSQTHLCSISRLIPRMAVVKSRPSRSLPESRPPLPLRRKIHSGVLAPSVPGTELDRGGMARTPRIDEGSRSWFGTMHMGSFSFFLSSSRLSASVRHCNKSLASVNACVTSASPHSLYLATSCCIASEGKQMELNLPLSVS